LLGTRWINRLLHATVLTPSRESTRELFRRILVADLTKVPPVYLQCAYLSRVIPGADLSWLTMLEQLVTLQGLREKYLISDELPRIKQPVLFLWGKSDWFAPPSVGEHACRLLPNARIEVLENAGHLPWLDQPERSADLVVQFLR
ncbi:MAG: alpha/beta fold hydrolase, partial [Pyrinomonadaceae bacterium]